MCYALNVFKQIGSRLWINYSSRKESACRWIQWCRWTRLRWWIGQGNESSWVKESGRWIKSWSCLSKEREECNTNTNPTSRLEFRAGPNDDSWGIPSGKRRDTGNTPTSRLEFRARPNDDSWKSQQTFVWAVLFVFIGFSKAELMVKGIFLTLPGSVFMNAEFFLHDNWLF